MFSAVVLFVMFGLYAFLNIISVTSWPDPSPMMYSVSCYPFQYKEICINELFNCIILNYEQMGGKQLDSANAISF